MQPESSKAISDTTSVTLDAIRAISAIVVMCAHAREIFFVEYRTLQSPSFLAKAFYTLTQLGDAAVVFFFVISGFLVGGSVLRRTARNAFDGRSYAVDRLARLYVVLIPAIVIGYFMRFVQEHAWSGHSLACTDVGSFWFPNALGNLVYLQNVVFAPPCNNAALWSLSNEFFYYALFPLLILSWRRRSALLAVIAAGIIAVLLFFTAPAALRGPPSYFTSHQILSAFPFWLMGAFIWNAKMPGRLLPAAVLVVLAAILAYPAATAMLGSLSRYQDWLGSAVIAAAACYLLTVASAARMPPAQVSTRLFEGLAAFSYSLYLTHMPLLYLIHQMVCASGHPCRLQFGLGALGIYGVAVAACFLWGLLFYSLFERRTPAIKSYFTKIMAPA